MPRRCRAWPHRERLATTTLWFVLEARSHPLSLRHLLTFEFTGGGLGGRHYTKAVSKPSFGHGPPSGPGFGRPGFRGGFGNDRGFRGGGRQGSGGFRGGGGSYGGRGGMGYGGPDSAPSGPRGPRGYGNNANLEPLPPRGGGYRDRDSYGSGQKRPHDGGGHDDPRQRRRY